ncbi:MAG: methyl-accepting chemotaxis protein [Eubacterium sp.]
MFKRQKMSVIITSAVAIVAAIGIIFLFAIANRNMTTEIRNKTTQNMQTTLNAKTKVIEEYIQQGESILTAYTQTPVLKEMLENLGDKKIQEKAENYTVQYFNTLDNWEGIYTGDWNTKVLTHPAKPVIGKVMREGDRLKELQDSMLASEGVLNAGIIVSPASGKLIVSMYRAIYDDNKKPIGYAGAGSFAASLKKKLDSVRTDGLDHAKSYMINTATSMHIFDEDESLMATEIKNPMLLKVVSDVKKNPKKTTGTIEYKDEKGEGCLAMYYAIPQRGWAVVISDTTKEIYAAAENNRKLLGIVCIVAYFIIVALTFVLVGLATKPLQVVEKAISDLRDLNLRRNSKMDNYIGGNSEVGHIATAVDMLRESLRNIIGTLNQCTVSLGECTKTINTESENLMDYMSNNSTITEQLAGGINTTNCAIMETNERIASIVETVESVESAIKDGQHVSDDLMHSAQEMQGQAKEALRSSGKNIEINRQNINKAMENLRSLSQINQMAAEILEITTQTNLLALNANIEAARAGEAGKGFAVVANEIGNLANSSSETATNIQNICNETNESIETVQGCFDDIIHFLETDVSRNFTDFAQNAESYFDAVEEIKKAIAEIQQTTGSFRSEMNIIREEMEKVKNAANDNEVGVAQIVRKNQLTNATTTALANVLNTNRVNTNRMVTIVKKFQTAEREDLVEKKPFQKTKRKSKNKTK